MELFLELILTVSLSLIFTSFLIKIASMQPLNTDSEEPLKIDKFQSMPLKEEVIKLEECENEGKTSVEFHNVAGVKEEDNKFLDVVVVDDRGKESETEYGDKDIRFGSEEASDGEDRRLCEIEIESVEEDEEEEEKKEENGIMDDWEEIGRKDFEELLGNKAGLYYVNVGVENYGN